MRVDHACCTCAADQMYVLVAYTYQLLSSDYASLLSPQTFRGTQQGEDASGLSSCMTTGERRVQNHLPNSGERQEQTREIKGTTHSVGTHPNRVMQEAGVLVSPSGKIQKRRATIYHTCFELEEEAALVRFWFEKRFDSSFKWLSPPAYFLVDQEVSFLVDHNPSWSTKKYAGKSSGAAVTTAAMHVSEDDVHDVTDWRWHVQSAGVCAGRDAARCEGGAEAL